MKFGTGVYSAYFSTGLHGETKPADEVEKYLAYLKDLFSYGVIKVVGAFPFVEPFHTSFYWDRVDAMVDWFAGNTMELGYHAVVWDKQDLKPDWYMSLSAGDRHDALTHHINQVLGRYEGKIKSYTLVNEPLHHGDVSDYMSTGNSLLNEIREIFRCAKAADPKAKLLLNEYGVMDSPILRRDFIKLTNNLLGIGAPVDALGVQCHFYESLPKDETILNALEELAQTGLPIRVTEFDLMVPDNPNSNFQGYSSWWAYQAYAYPHFYQLISNRAESINMWGFYDGEHWRPGAGLVDTEFNPKEVYYGMGGIL